MEGVNRDDLRAAIVSLQNTMAFDSRDWAQDKRDAWLYGILLGWDSESPTETDDAMAELIAKHDWPPKTVERLRRYAAAVKAFVDEVPS